jgi:TRF2-interacting telomeric protein/Rap1 - C terminal domain/Rap1 Myb domain
MTSAVVYDGVRNDEGGTNGLFAGQKIWFSNTVPQRTRFMEDVRANGGEVVPVEKQADICLFDHARKNPPPGMYSYRYVEYSIRKGQREDLEAHRIGGVESRAARPVGSVTMASKGSRNTFSEADDQFLWNWVKPYEGLRGSAGNVIYQQLEAANPRHTFQSWRDRWLKYVQHQKRDITPRHGEQRGEVARVAEHPRTARTIPSTIHARATPVSESAQVSVDVPVAESPRRKRGRPRKVQREDSNEDITILAHSATPKQPQTPTGSTRKGNVQRTSPEITPAPKPKENAGSWEFSNEERDLLLKAVKVIIEVRKESDLDAAWERMAESYQAHTAEQWKNYFNEVVLPLYLKQKGKQEQNESTKGADGGGINPTGSASGQTKQQRRQTEQSPADRIRPDGNRNGEAAALKADRRQRSPSFRPQSPTDWRQGNGEHRPTPNESRKRSSAKSNSQESTLSQSLDGEGDGNQGPPRITEPKRQSNKHVREPDQQPNKRRKLSASETTVLEIPSTPENTQESESLEDLPGTPTPRARKQLRHGSRRSLSPLFLPSTSSDEEENLPTAGDQGLAQEESVNPETRTSPISVHLVSDHDPTIPSSSSAANRKGESESIGSPTPEFETAPDFSQIHEAASEEEEEEFETAAEEQAPYKAPMPDTQALFTAPIQTGEGSLDLGLPEPDGGWDAADADLDLDLDVEEEPPNNKERPATSPASPTPSTTSTLSLDAWIALRTAEGQDATLLLEAAETTNMHKQLADLVYESLERGSGVPENMRGVWTKEDDELLMGTDARGIKRVQEKHGPRGVDERFECLGVWNE